MIMMSLKQAENEVMDFFTRAYRAIIQNAYAQKTVRRHSLKIPTSNEDHSAYSQKVSSISFKMD